MIRECTRSRGRTCVEEGVGGKGNAASFGQQRGQRDTLGLELLIQRVKLVCRDCVGHPELRHLHAATIILNIR